MGFHGLQIGFPASLSTMGHRLCHLSETFRRPRNDVLLRCPCVHWRPVLRGLHQSVHTKNTRQVHRCLSICQTNVKIHLFHTLIAQVTALPVGNQRLKKLSFEVSDRWAIQLPYICSCSIVPRSSSGGRRLIGLWCAIASALRPSKALAPPVLHW